MAEDEAEGGKGKKPDIGVYTYHKTDEFQKNFRRWQRDQLDRALKPKKEEKEEKKDAEYKFGED